MKTIGIVGGIGPESTIDYYRALLDRLRARGDATGADVLINSIDVGRLLALAARDDRSELTEFLLQAVERLARGGADLALFAGDTPHIVFDDVERRASIPLVSIVVAAREAAHALGMRRAGLLGTSFTVQGAFYPRAFAVRDIEVVVSEAEDRDYVHGRYVGELVAGNFRPETRAGVVAVMDRMRERHAIDGVVLGGTELPLLLRGVSYRLPLLDTTRIHIEAVIAAAFPDATVQPGTSQ